MSLTHARIRLELETTAPLDTTKLVEQRTQARARMGYSRAVRYEVAVVKNGTISTEVTDLSSITLCMKPLTTSGYIDPAEDSVLEKTVSTINSSLTQDQWDNDDGSTPYHAAFEFTDAETAVSMSGSTNNELGFGLAFTGLTSAGRVTLATGYVTLVNDGAVITGGTPPVATRTMTDGEILALLASKVGFTGNPVGSIIELPSAANKTLLIWADDEADGSVTLKAESVT